MKKLIVLLASLLLFSSCNNDVNITQPIVDPANFLNETKPLKSSSKAVMEGIYEVVQGKDLLGDQVAVKWTGNQLSMFAGKDGGFIVINGGSLESVLFFFGYWRHITQLETGAVNFYISSDEGGEEIIKGDTTSNITFTGTYGNGNENPGKSLKLKYKRPFSQKVKNSGFYILAHRGGGRNSEYLGVSENSIDMINFASSFGATGVEIDARLSKDGVPFLYHDNDVNLRLVQKSLIWGNIEDFTWKQLSLLTLRNGEKIPSLREALEFILEKTELKVVWLDTKDIDVISHSATLQKEILDRAAVMGRDLKIYIGLPAEDVYNEFIKLPDYQNIPSLCELTTDMVRTANSQVWAPRWTQGTQNANVQQMQAEGRKAFVWTLDEPGYIEEFIKEGNFDGVLSNYPSIVAYFHYIQE